MPRPKEFFEENHRLFSNAQGTPEQIEKFNLYGGLYGLAKQIDNMNSTLENIEARIGNVESKVR